MNEKIVKVLDESGLKRSFTVPYVDGQGMDEHIQAVGQAAGTSGGLTNNLLMTAHHSGGKGWGSKDGHTVGYNADKLRSTIIPKDDENAKAAIEATQKHLNNLEKLLGKDNATVKTANGQLALVKKTEGAGMNLLDFSVLLTQVVFRPNQEVAREHQGTKSGGHHAKLMPPGRQDTPDGDTESSDSDEGGSQSQDNAQAAPAAGGDASQAQQVPPTAGAAPAGPQAQG